MKTLKAFMTTTTNVSWKDEISYSHDIKSGGLEELKEALRQAELSNPESSNTKTVPEH
jgi:hypothetical protein